MNAAETVIRQMVDGMRRLNVPMPLAYEIIGEYGQPVQPRVIGGGVDCECYANTGRYVTQGDRALHYCEGWVVTEKCPIPIFHAWVYDEASGEFLDPSPMKGEWSYFGVTFTRAGYAGIVTRTRLWAVFENLYRWRQPLDTVRHELREAIFKPKH